MATGPDYWAAVTGVAMAQLTVQPTLKSGPGRHLGHGWGLPLPRKQGRKMGEE